MTETELRYFDWLCSKVGAGRNTSYQNRRRLFSYLHNKTFYYTNLYDSSRISDALSLRREFGERLHLPDDASCLEVLISLALKIDRDIIGSSPAGSGAARIFCDMLISLELFEMEDNHYDEEAACVFVDRWLERAYDYNGYGGCFTVQNPPRDMRDLDLWYQANAYLNEIL